MGAIYKINYGHTDTKKTLPAVMGIYEACSYLRVGYWTLRGLIERGVIPCRKPTPHTYRIPTKALDEYLAGSDYQSAESGK